MLYQSDASAASGAFSEAEGLPERKNKKQNRACLKLCVVALLNPKKEEVRPHVSAHGIPKVLNSQGDSCHIHLISLHPFPARYLRTNRFFFLVVFLFKAMREKRFALISTLRAINFYKLAWPLVAPLASQESNPQEGRIVFDEPRQ